MNEPRPTSPQGPPLQGPQRSSIVPPTQGPPKIAPLPSSAPKPKETDTEPLSLVDDVASGATSTPSKIKAFSVGGPSAAVHNFKRQPAVTGHGAIRVRSFHGRLSDEGLTFIDEKINEWIDQHPEIEVKFATTTIGTFEGKIREPAIVINVWY